MSFSLSSECGVAEERGAMGGTCPKQATEVFVHRELKKYNKAESPQLSFIIITTQGNSK